MILTIGEILADVFGERAEGKLKMTAAVGGAPFNAAVAAKRAGAAVGFIGRVGKDSVGDFLESSALSFGLDPVRIQRDPKRNTTLAFVVLENGERSFSFFRNDSADIFIESVDLDEFKDLSTLHIGTLMLSEDYGRRFASSLIADAKRRGVRVAVDLNFRESLFESERTMLAAFEEVIAGADIIKLSDDEAELVSGERGIEKALAALATKFADKLVAVTAGKIGSYLLRGGKKLFVPSQRQVFPLDTTGAGDAFFGTMLAGLDRAGLPADISERQLVGIFRDANAAGAEATTRLGAI